MKTAEKVVLIDGCFLRCHGRIVENIIDREKLIQFDALLSHYNRYTDIFDYDDVPEVERKEVAQSVANWVIECLNGNVQIIVLHHVRQKIKRAVDVADRIHAFLMLILIPKKGEPHWSRKLMPD